MRAAAAALVALLAGGAAAQAPVATDGTLGPAVALDYAGGELVIGAGLGAARGANLFHSFNRFAVPAGNVARFEAPAGVGRVIARVTGGGVTRLDGIVAASARADVWMISPGGIAIGAGAQFRLLGGGVFLSAGDAIGFADGATFAAEPAAAPVLSFAAPESFGFVGPAQGRLTVSGDLALNGALALAGGEVLLERATVVIASGGGAALIAGGPGDAAPVAATAPAPRPRGGAIRVLGDGPVAGTRGETMPTAGLFLRGGGVARVSAGTVTVDGADVRVDRDGGDPESGLRVIAETVVVRRDGALRTTALGGAVGGDIVIEGFSSLLVTRDGAGSAVGETVIEAEVLPRATGWAGAVRIVGGALTLADEGRVFSNTSGVGDAGPVTVAVERLSLSGGGQIASAAIDVKRDGEPPAAGAGGRVSVTVGDGADIRGRGRTFNPGGGDFEPSGVFASTEGAVSGPGGSVIFTAPKLTLADRAEIGAETRNAAPAGTVTLRLGTMSLTNGASVTTRSVDAGAGAGAAGAIDIAVEGSAAVTARALVTSVAGPPGAQAGAIALTAANLTLSGGARITTDSAATDGGAIRIGVPGLTLLDGGVVTTSVAASDGDGGAVTLTGGPLVLRGGAAIRANAGAGDGGAVTIGNVARFVSADSVIEADSATGQDGSVALLGADGTTTAEAAPPPVAFFDAFALADDGCVAAVTGGSALSLVGPGGAPFTGASQPALFGGAVPYPVPGVAVAAVEAPPPAPCAGARR